MRASIAVLAAACSLVLIAIAPAQEEDREVVITGRVLLDADGSPVAGIVVEIGVSSRRTMAFEGERSTRTDAEGGFRFVGLPRGAASLQVSGPGFATEIRRLRRGATEPQVFRLVKGRSIRGQVLAADSGLPIAGAIVVAERHRVRTDAEGRFALEGLRYDLPRIAVAAEAPSYVPVMRTVAADEAEAGTTLMLEQGWMLVVKATDAQGQPLADAAVEARLPRAVAYSALERAAYVATTDARGRAVLRGLPPRHPIVAEVSREGFLRAQSPVVLPVTATRHRQGDARRIHVVLVADSTCIVHVIDGDRKPLGGARVRLRPLIGPRLSFGGPPAIEMSRGSYREGQAGADGVVAFDRLPDDWITCEVSAPGFRTRQLAIPAGRKGPCAFLVALSRDPDPPGEDLPWSRAIGEAWQRVDREGLPLLISMTMDDEPANDHMAGHHWHDPEVVRVARELPLLLSTVFQHTELDGVCARYGAIPCASHQVVESYAVGSFVGQASFQVPRQIFVDPAGRVLMHRVFYLSERELIRMMMRALRVVKPEVAVRLARERLRGTIEDLRARSDRRRAEAILALATLANAGDEHAISLLLDLRRFGVQADARLLLLSLLIPEAIPFPAAAYRSVIADPDPRIRLEACSQLARVAEDPGVLALLSERLADDAPGMRAAVHAALRITEEHGDVTVADAADAAEGERWRIVATLLETIPVEHLPGLQPLLGTLEGTPRHRLLRAIAAQAPSPAAFQILVEECGRDGLTAAVPALVALRKAAPAAPDPRLLLSVLRPHLDRRDPLIREAALRAIAALSLPPVRGILRQHLDDNTLSLRTTAALALWERGERSHAALLLEALDDPLLGPAVQVALRRHYESRRPQSPEEWRHWLEREGDIDAEEDE